MDHPYPLWKEGAPFPELYELKEPLGIEKIMVQDGTVDDIAFLHDSAVLRAGGRTIVAWYNSTVAEIVGESMIRGRFSDDDGKTWSAPIVMASDEGGEGLHYVPVDLFEKDGEIYAFISKMTSHDRPVSYDIHRLDDQYRAEFLRSIAGAFIANTPPIPMDNGNYLIAGRAADTPGGHPEVPAVLISDGPNLLGDWRLVPFYDLHNPALWGLNCPETTVWVDGGCITAFVRHDDDLPHLIFVSEDYGETWSQPRAIPLEIAISKITAGTLLDGRKYLVYNHRIPGKSTWDRDLLLIAVDEDGSGRLSKVYRLLAGYEPELGRGGGWSYPCAVEDDGVLYISLTNQYGAGPRSCVLLKVPVASL